MKPLPTQFSASGFSGAVATPTCSSCCCCCCCVATVTAGSTALAQEVYTEAKKRRIPQEARVTYVTLAALLVPAGIMGAVVAGQEGDLLFASVVGWGVIAAGLWALLRSVGAKDAGIKSLLASMAVVVAVGVELFVGVWLLMNAAPFYLLFAVVAIIASISFTTDRVRRRLATTKKK